MLHQGLSSRVEMTENSFNEIEERSIEFIQSEQQEEKRLEKNEQNLRDLWDNNKRSNIYISGVPEGEEKREWGQKGIQGSTVMTKIFGK